MFHPKTLQNTTTSAKNRKSAPSFEKIGKNQQKWQNLHKVG
jgi:hypothetical protein